eukprot:221709_1
MRLQDTSNTIARNSAESKSITPPTQVKQVMLEMEMVMNHLILHIYHLLFLFNILSKDAYLSSVSSLILQDLLSEHDNVTLEEFNVPPPRIWLSMLLEKSRLLFILRAD